MHYWMIIELVIIAVGVCIGILVAIIKACSGYRSRDRCGFIKDLCKLTVESTKETLPEWKPFFKYYLILN